MEVIRCFESVRVNFRLHTKKDKEFQYAGEQNSFILECVRELKKSNISVGVITNHNKFDLDDFKALKKRAQKRRHSQPAERKNLPT